MLESEQQSEECGAEGKAFTLLHESDTPISAALEHSDRLQQHASLLHPTCMFTLWISTKPQHPAPFNL